MDQVHPQSKCPLFFQQTTTELLIKKVDEEERKTISTMNKAVCINKNIQLSLITDQFENGKFLEVVEIRHGDFKVAVIAIEKKMHHMLILLEHMLSLTDFFVSEVMFICLHIVLNSCISRVLVQAMVFEFGVIEPAHC